MPDLPGGTITFLFTDIEGSTRHWEENPEGMRLALARHDAAMRTAIANYHGSIFKTMGDAFCVAFQTAPEAVGAALAAQQALQAAAWPESVTIRVRMALHTGTAEGRNGDYFGLPVNRVARLLAAASGGQILLSEVVQELCRDLLPPWCSLRNLGEHRLRDLKRPETIYQLLHPTLIADFSPLKSLNNVQLPNNLPLQITSFIGRDKAIGELKRLLERARLLTLTGMGGCGKTRLSLQIASDILDDYPDGVWLVELASISESCQIIPTIAAVLNVTEQPGEVLLQKLLYNLRSKKLLLLLDNCEHLLSDCARFVTPLLRSCPNVRVLATSREPLNIAGEQTYPVLPLALPDLNQLSTLESVSQYEAVQLFIDRTRLIQPDFVVTNKNAPALAQICSRLDGIPLAIELAAAKVRTMPVESINARLDDRFRLLTGGSRSALPRQQTLRALIDWSHDLLTAQERILFARLSVFSGGWVLGSAEQICSATGTAHTPIHEWEVMDLLTSLVDKSLIVADPLEGITRYRMLETVRQYAAERLDASGERNLLRAQHRDHFLTLTEASAPRWTETPSAIWLQQLRTERDNLQVALTFCIDDPDARQGTLAGLRLASVLLRFWLANGYWTEGRTLLTHLLNRSSTSAPSLPRAAALDGAGDLATVQGDYKEAIRLYEESREVAAFLGDKEGIARALYSLGDVAALQNDLTGSQRLFSESQRICHEMGDIRGVAFVLNQRGGIARLLGEYDLARNLYEECLNLHKGLEDRSGIALCYQKLATVTRYQGDYVAAMRYYELSQRLCREAGDLKGVAESLLCQGRVAQAQGDQAMAEQRFEEGLKLLRELGIKSAIANALMPLGELASQQGDYLRAHKLHLESKNLFRELGNKSGLAWSLISLGTIAYQQGCASEARNQMMEGLRLFEELNDVHGMATALESLAFATTSVAKNDTPDTALRATRLWATAATLRECLQERLPAENQQKNAEEQMRLCTLLTEPLYSAAWTEGSRMHWEAALTSVLYV